MAIKPLHYAASGAVLFLSAIAVDATGQALPSTARLTLRLGALALMAAAFAAAMQPSTTDERQSKGGHGGVTPRIIRPQVADDTTKGTLRRRTAVKTAGESSKDDQRARAANSQNICPKISPEPAPTTPLSKDMSTPDASNDALRCPAGFDAEVFAALPLAMQKEAIKVAEKKIKRDKAAAERRTKDFKKKMNSKTETRTSDSAAATVEISASTVENETQDGGIVIPSDCQSASTSAKALNQLLADVRAHKNEFDKHAAADNKTQVHAVANSIMKLQMKLDDIDHDGNQEVRLKRKESVKSLNALLDAAEKFGWKTDFR